MQSWLVDLYNHSPISSWLLFVLIISIASRTIMTPLSWQAFRRQQILAEQASVIGDLHNRYESDPRAYEYAFRDFKRQTGVRVDGIITGWLVVLLPLLLVGFLLFRSYPAVLQMPDELGLGLTDLVILGDIDAIWLVALMSLALGAIFAWSSRKLPERFKRYRVWIVIIPVILQVLIYSTIPLYFNVYIACSILFGIVQTTVFQRLWQGHEPIVINMQSIEEAVRENKKI